MAKKVFGLVSIQAAPIASDGDVGTDFFTIGETVQGTCTMAQADNTTTDFAIEESDSPILSIKSQAGALTLSWSSYNIKYYILKRLFGGTGNLVQANGAINTLGTITPGTGYTTGYYENVALSGGAGTGAIANIKVSGGGVTAIDFTALGSGYAVANALTTAAANIGGTGSGFTVNVASVYSAALAESWQAPDSLDETEWSLKVTDKNGNTLVIPRAKIAAKLGLSFAKDKLGQMDFVGTILQPTKVGVKRLTLTVAQ